MGVQVHALEQGGFLVPPELVERDGGSTGSGRGVDDDPTPQVAW